MATIKSPIWKDVNIKITGSYGLFVYYKISVDGNDIFFGKCHQFNGVYTFMMNDICKDYLSSTINFNLIGYQQNTNYSKTFSVYISGNGTSYTKSDDVTFTYDWSYINYSGVYENILSDNITDVVDNRQYIIFSGFSDNLNNFNVYIDNTITSTPSYGSEITYVRHLNSSNKTVQFNYGSYTRKFNVVDTCKNYCLYYLNARGGWDWFVIDGVSTKEYSYDRKYYAENYDNTTLNFGKVNYKNNISESWTLNTGYMTDSQSEKMFNLFGSRTVYLHNLVDDVITPVVITNKSSVEKTFKNQNRSLYNYTITVENSQEKYRM